MNTSTFRQMVQARVTRQLTALADKEAARIVSQTVRRHGIAAAPTTPTPAATPKPKRVRDRGSKHHQYAPKGCWLSLGRVPVNAKVLTGQLQEAMAIANLALASGGAGRSELTQLIKDANPGWTKVTASSCISRLVAMGRLNVVEKPRNN